MTPRERFFADYAVPRGTIAAFDTYAALLADWQSRMNLVGPATLPALWDRHFADSAQLVALAPTDQPWLDIGAGAGFPGIVVALLTGARVHLVESVGKKASFLNALIQELALHDRVTVEHARVESMPCFPVGVITARACAPLAQLFDWGQRFATHSTLWVLPKGQTVDAELAAAQAAWRFDAALVPSRTDPRGRIVVARDVRRA